MKTIVFILCYFLIGRFMGFGQKDTTLQKPQRNLLNKSIVQYSMSVSEMLLSNSSFELPFNKISPKGK